MSIGTAKVTPAEQKGVKHHFVDSHSIDEVFTAAQFAKQAHLIIETLFETNDYVVMTGGSGMFVDALIDGIDDLPASKELKQELIEFHELYGLEPLLAELFEKDPEYYERVDRGNPSRIIRAIEVIRLSNTTYTSQRIGKSKELNFTVRRFILEHPREELYKRIERRVDEMLLCGLLDEVKSLLPFREHNALRTVGYAELFDYLDGIISFERAVELIKQHTRNYAKRQITWLKRYEDATRIPFSAEKQMLEQIIQECR